MVCLWLRAAWVDSLMDSAPLVLVTGTRRCSLAGSGSTMVGSSMNSVGFCAWVALRELRIVVARTVALAACAAAALLLLFLVSMTL